MELAFYKGKTINIRNKKQSDGSKKVSAMGKIRKEKDRKCKVCVCRELHFKWYENIIFKHRLFRM